MRLKESDEHALALLYDRHSGLVYKLARAIAGGTGDAEEVTTDVFVRLWERPEAYDPQRGTLRSWLATVARSRALDRVRARKRREAAHARSSARDAQGSVVERTGPEPSDQAAHVASIRTALDGALSGLNADQRRAIELAYFAGLSQSEIADRLGEPLGTVKTRIRDGMKKLREIFARPGGGA